MFRHHFTARSSGLCLALLVALVAATASAQTTQFTYQGRLTDSSLPANGSYDFQFKLFDALAGGSQVGGTLSPTNVTVTNGIFTVTLDFGSAVFPGANCWLDISVRLAGGGGFTTLSPRQPISSTPYAIKSLSAANADSLSVACINCVTSSQIGGVLGSQVTGAIPVASVPAGSSNYLQNSTTLQTGANFNISGNGTVGGTLSGYNVNATTQFNLNGARVLSASGTNNLFSGYSAGQANTTGGYNAFFGSKAGQANTTGYDNAFFGHGAGQVNTTGSANSFFGSLAGYANTTAGNNAFFGYGAGQVNTGSANSFFGAYAGHANTTGVANAFFGYGAGQANTNGQQNSFFGYDAGQDNTTGNYNAFFGEAAGLKNTTGGLNAFFGYFSSYNNTTGQQNSFFGPYAGQSNTTGNYNIGIGLGGGGGLTTGSYNIDIGAQGLPTDANTIRIGDYNQTRAFISGIRGITTGVANAVNVLIDSNGQLGTLNSSRRYKEDIKDMDHTSNRLMALRPVTFRYQKPYANGEKPIQFGLIAEEVAETFPELAVFNEEGQPETVKYQDLTPMLLNEVQKQAKTIQQQEQTALDLKAENEVLKRQNAALAARLTALEQVVQRLFAQPPAQATLPQRRSSASKPTGQH